jgi:23S rRNA 5-hydroxycytidine C2501 synthase
VKRSNTIELLAPARNIESGMEAIKHGADAVYIGAPRFGARQAAGNSVNDIATLTEFAHKFFAKVYVTINTILDDSELKDAEQLINELYLAGVDAILVQDTAILKINLPPIALHASTQMDIRTIDKVRFLSDNGFSRVVLARELSLDEISGIHDACPDVELECFVHGALCVSYSGQCYASQNCFSRSANRGECAQFCRLPFDLIDSDGKVIRHEKHLLSLKDMKRIDYLEEMMDAGVVSFKIEGRLKDTSYVKNVTACYNRRMEEILKRRKDYIRSSSGHSSYNFEPVLEKSFNRGFTDYFLHGRSSDIFSFNTPKSIGEPMGLVKDCGNGWAIVSGIKSFHNGDGLCFFNEVGQLEGYRVNKVENGRISFFVEGHSLQPRLKKGMQTYRNFDQEMDKFLSKESAVRNIRVDILLEDTPNGFVIRMTDEDGLQASVETVYNKEKAHSSQTQNIKTQLLKLGGSIFESDDVIINMQEDWFIPSSILSDMRRRVVDSLTKLREVEYLRPERKRSKPGSVYPISKLTYLGNVMNAQARTFYQDHGVKSVDDAFEKTPATGVPIVFCKHCLRYAFGWCPKYQKEKSPYNEPYYLITNDGRKFELRFDCRNCQMEVIN